MELNEKQKQGLKLAVARFRMGEKYTVISGFAGSGKSTLVSYIISALNINENRVAYVSFTGKAAEVLRKKGNKNAMTLHRLLFESIPKPNGGFYRKRKEHLERYYDVIVIDEISMAPKSLIDILFNHKVHIICLGDPGQLPPINKDEDNLLLNHPHIFLDEIMRQEAESEIIQLTMKIRNNEPIDYYEGKEVMVIPKSELLTGHLLWGDVILTATNRTRHQINNQVRELLGFSGTLQEGEKIIFKRNYWEDFNDDNDVLVNGILGKVNNVYDSFIQIPKQIPCKQKRVPTIMCDFQTDYGSPFVSINLDKEFIINETPCLDWKTSYRLGKMINQIGDIIPRQATYGYAITCHAAQGSEWDKVVILEEKFPFDKEEHSRWLYTACTRASEKLVLVR